ANAGALFVVCTTGLSHSLRPGCRAARHAGGDGGCTNAALSGDGPRSDYGAADLASALDSAALLRSPGMGDGRRLARAWSRGLIARRRPNVSWRYPHDRALGPGSRAGEPGGST